jgi:hypothetical protein
VPIIGGAALNHPDLLKRGKRFANGLLLVDSFFSGSHEEVVQRFVLQYELLHGNPPAVLESACYDSARFLFELIGRGNVYREDLTASLSLTTPSASILRSNGFNLNREMEHSMLVLQVKKGKFTQVYPPPPENPIRYGASEDGVLFAHLLDEEGQKVEIPVPGQTQLRLPPEEAEDDGGSEPEAVPSVKEAPAPTASEPGAAPAP